MDVFLSEEALPFALALTVVAGLFALEILSALLGASILGAGGDGADLDLDLDIEADFDLSADMGVDFAEAPELDLEADASSDFHTAPSGVWGWIGLRDVPFLIWLVSFLTLFGLSGLMLQSAVFAMFGAMLPAALAVALAVIPAIAVTRVIANWVALIMPKTETSAVRSRHLGGCRGTITQGTARRGKPAEVKVRDHYGNIHYLRVEPLHETDVFEQGADVRLIRKRGDRFYVI